jgi:diguanylate cyclase (GGDEF)-like protein
VTATAGVPTPGWWSRAIGTRSRLLIAVALAVMWLAGVAALALLLSHDQTNARREVTERLEAGVKSGAEFADLSVQDLLTRETAQARLKLSSAQVTRAQFVNAANAVDASTAVLLDRSGRVLQVLPAVPGAVGQNITGTYPFLTASLQGRAAVSDVVPAVGGQAPVVAFAVPFPSAAGRRVFVAAVAVSVGKTALDQYMSYLVSTPGTRVFLTDSRGSLIASSRPFAAHETLGQADPGLAGHTVTQRAGSYASAHGSQWFETVPIAGTPWKIVMSVPTATLFASVRGFDHALAWFVLVGLAFAGVIIIVIGSRLVGSRRSLAALNRELDRLARVDALTGLHNRRGIEESLSAAVSSAVRREAGVCVLLIDIDHFKLINDTFGHQAGDLVLREAAQEIRGSLRLEDVLGRWGGEEFLAVLPQTEAPEAADVAERLRANVAAAALSCPITVTIGVADWSSGEIEELIERADSALYAGKSHGRNTVELVASP